MKLSLDWLQEWVEVLDFKSKPQALAKVLTQAGLEVESIEDLKSQYQQVKVGLILKKESHPEADRLSVCQVTTGHGVIHQIVCGAKNHQENDRVVVALPGALLPNGMSIKDTILRNVESKGMLCSLSELGLPLPSAATDGILILPADATVGMDFSSYYQLDDVVMELKVTPNRADCLSHLGLAREIAALLGRPLKKQICETQFGVQNPSVSLSVASSECSRYLGITLTDVIVAPSPMWLQQRLIKLGLKSINNVVDITNYIMLERGQPLHAFDQEAINQGHIEVRAAKAGETLLALDDKVYSLSAEDLVIADAQGPIALAGVIGGKDSAIKNETTTIFLEAAVFSPVQIRKTSRRLGIQTDSAYRFSRGVDASGTEDHFLKAIDWLQRLAGAQVKGQPNRHQSPSQVKEPIPLALAQVTQRLGFTVEPAQVIAILKQLQCEVKNQEEATIWVTPPTWRFDLEQEIDLIEECGRIIGFDQIPETLPNQNVVPSMHQKEYLDLRRIRNRSLYYGFSEVVLPCLINQEREQEFLGAQSQLESWGFNAGEAVKLLNPLSEEMSHLRRSLSYGLFQAGVSNLRQNNRMGRLFEVGTVVTQNNKSYQENYHWSALVWGQSHQVWQKRQVGAPLVLELVESIQGLFKQYGLSIEKPQDRSLLPGCLHRGQSAFIYWQKQIIGFVGTLHPNISNEFKLREPMAMAEINLKLLLAQETNQPLFKAFSRFPKVERDLSLVVPRNLPAFQLEKIFINRFNKYLQGIELFDLYEGEKVPVGHKQLGYRFTLQSPTGTLAEGEVNELMDQLLQQLKVDYGIHLREA